MSSNFFPCSDYDHTNTTSFLAPGKRISPVLHKKTYLSKTKTLIVIKQKVLSKLKNLLPQYLSEDTAKNEPLPPFLQTLKQNLANSYHTRGIRCKATIKQILNSRRSYLWLIRETTGYNPVPRGLSSALQMVCALQASCIWLKWWKDQEFIDKKE